MLSSLSKNVYKVIFGAFFVVIAGVSAALLEAYAILIALGVILFLLLAVVIFERPFYGVLITALLLPFERIGSFELVSITVKPSYIFAALTIIAWVLNFLVFRRGFKARNPVIGILLLFVGVSVLSIIDASNVTRSLMVLGFEIFMIIFMIALVDLVKTKKKFEIILRIMLVVCFFISVFGIYQFLGDMVGLPSEVTGLREQYTKDVFGFPRVQSVALEPLYYANYLLIPISVLLVMYLRQKDSRKLLSVRTYRDKVKDFLSLERFDSSANVVFFVVLTLAILNLILTLSRGGFLGLGIVLLLALILKFRQVITVKNIIIISIGLVVAVVAGYLILVKTGDEDNLEVFTQQATTYDTGAGVEERFKSYDEAIYIFERNFWFGVGVGNFGPEFSGVPHITPDDGWLIVNNEYLEIAAERGVFGVIIFISLLIFITIRSYKAYMRGEDKLLKDILVALMIAFIAIMVQYLTFSTLYILHIWFLIGLIVICQNLLLKTGKQLNDGKK